MSRTQGTRSIWRLAVLSLVGCGGSGSVEQPSAPDAAQGEDAAGSGLPTTCDSGCLRTDLTADFGGTRRGFDRAYYGVTVAAAGATLHVEALTGGDPGCPTQSSPAADRVFSLPSLAVPMATAEVTARGRLFDFVGDLLPTVPSAAAESVMVTPVAANLCLDCVGRPAPSDADGLLVLDINAVFTGANAGTIRGRVAATHCDSFDTDSR